MTGDAASVPVRAVPRLTDLNRPFWTSGADGLLRLQRCTECERYVHPPALRCPHDYGTLKFQPVSGHARVVSWTSNRHSWFPNFPPPYLIAFVAPVEDEGVRLLTNLVGVETDEVVAAMPVRVRFERDTEEGEIYFPLFEPAWA